MDKRELVFGHPVMAKEDPYEKAKLTICPLLRLSQRFSGMQYLRDSRGSNSQGTTSRGCITATRCADGYLLYADPRQRERGQRDWIISAGHAMIEVI